MKNTIKNNRAAELAAKQEAEKAAARKAELDAIEPKDVVKTMTEVIEGTARADRDEKGNTRGTNGGKYLQVHVNGTTIAAKTKEEIDAIKERIEKGISGDGLLHKTVFINGMKCDCVGANEKELEADIKAAEDYAKAHGHNVIRDIDIAEQLVEAEFKQDDLEQIESHGEIYLLCYSARYIMDTAGNTIVDLSDIDEKLSKKTIKNLLVERLETKVKETVCNEDVEDTCDESEDDLPTSVTIPLSDLCEFWSCKADIPDCCDLDGEISTYLEDNYDSYVDDFDYDVECDRVVVKNIEWDY